MRLFHRFIALGFLLVTLCRVCVSQAQSQGFNYQAVVRDETGTILQGQEVTIVFDILIGSPNGNSVFNESHIVLTNDFGLVNLVIGSINPASFDQIDWGADEYYYRVSLNGTQIGEVEQFESIPFSKVATDMKIARLVDVSDQQPIARDILRWNGSEWVPDTDLTADGDTSAINEIQEISIEGNRITLSKGGGTITLNEVIDGDGDPTNEIQTLSKDGNQIILSDGGGSVIDEVEDADADPTNEIQELAFDRTNGQLSISNGNSVIIPTGTTGGGANNLGFAHRYAAPSIGDRALTNIPTGRINRAVFNELVVTVPASGFGVLLLTGDAKLLQGSNAEIVYGFFEASTNRSLGDASLAISNFVDEDQDHFTMATMSVFEFENSGTYRFFTTAYKRAGDERNGVVEIGHVDMTVLFYETNLGPPRN